MKFRVEDSSPLLVYSTGWEVGSSREDPDFDQYSDNTFMATNLNGSSVTFQFYGTSIEIGGSLRSNHGRYSVELDGQIEMDSVSGSTSPDRFQVPIVEKRELPLGEHTVRVVNMENKYLDVDYVVWDSRVGNDDGSAVRVLTIKPDDERYFGYEDRNAWSAPVNFRNETFLGGFGRSTSLRDASVKVTFKGQTEALENERGSEELTASLIGDAISLYGPVGPRAASRYSVRLNEDEQLFEYSATRVSPKHQQLLYHANNLDRSRKTTIELTNHGAQGGELAIDFATIFNPPQEDFNIGGASHNPSVIFGLTFSTAIAVMSMITLILILLRYRFGWFPFLTFISPSTSRATAPSSAGRRSTRRASDHPTHSDFFGHVSGSEPHSPTTPTPPRYPRLLLPQFALKFPRSSKSRGRGHDESELQSETDNMTFTEISEYPFSTSDYYAQTQFSKSPGMTSSAPPMTLISHGTRTTKSSANRDRSGSRQARMSGIHEVAEEKYPVPRHKTSSSMIAHSWLIRNGEMAEKERNDDESPGWTGRSME